MIIELIIIGKNFLKMKKSNKERILEKFEKHKGEIILSFFQCFRLIGVGQDEMDYYWIYFDGSKLIWDSCVGGFMVLKGKIDDKDYEEMKRLCEFNHYDFVVKKANSDKYTFEELEKELFKDYDNDRNELLTKICWDLN